MRLRSALVLLLFAWRLGIPMVALAETGEPVHGSAVTASTESDGSNAWLPRSASIDDATRLTERQGARLPLDRWISYRAGRLSAGRTGRRPPRIRCRPSYPSRRVLHHRLVRSATDSPPA